MSCPFCNEGLEIVCENGFAFAIYDKYPVNQGHILIIPKRHVSDFFETTPEEREAISALLQECKSIIDKSYSPDGYNIGVNVGKTAGQTIFHVHVHLIPRYEGDMTDPRGGVRGVIPEKRIY